MVPVATTQFYYGSPKAVTDDGYVNVQLSSNKTSLKKTGDWLDLVHGLTWKVKKRAVREGFTRRVVLSPSLDCWASF